MDANDLPSDLLGINDAARLGRCSPSQLWRWIRKGRLPGWKRLGRTFVSAADVRALFRPVPVRPAPQPREPAAQRRAREAWVQRELERHGLA